MITNVNQPLVMSDLYCYDIEKCNYTLLTSIGWNVVNIDADNKLNRNINIGYLQKHNKHLTYHLTHSTSDIINDFIRSSNLKPDNIIIRQKDGLITSSPVNGYDTSISVKLRYTISKLIMHENYKSKFIIIKTDGDVLQKGLERKPTDLSIFNLFNTIDFSTTGRIVSSIENIRNVIFESNNVFWFTFNYNSSYLVPILDQGYLKLNRSTLKLIDTTEIDKRIVWNGCIWPFCKSIITTT